jgi:hypothetical protein
VASNLVTATSLLGGAPQIPEMPVFTERLGCSHLPMRTAAPDRIPERRFGFQEGRGTMRSQLYRSIEALRPTSMLGCTTTTTSARTSATATRAAARGRRQRGSSASHPQDKEAMNAP